MNATWLRPFLSQLRVWLSWLTLSLVKKKEGGIGEEKSSDLNGTHFCVFWRYSICCMNGASLTNLMCTLTSGSGLHIHLVNTCNFTTIMVWKVIMQWSRCWWEAKCTLFALAWTDCVLQMPNLFTCTLNKDVDVGCVQSCWGRGGGGRRNYIPFIGMWKVYRASKHL